MKLALPLLMFCIACGGQKFDPCTSPEPSVRKNALGCNSTLPVKRNR